MIVRDDHLGRGDLCPHRGLLDGGADDVRDQTQIGRLEFEALILCLSIQRLHLAAIRAEHVGRVAHGQFRGVEVVDDRRIVGRSDRIRAGRDHRAVALDAGGVAAGITGELLALELVGGAESWEEIALLGIHEFLCLGERGARSRH